MVCCDCRALLAPALFFKQFKTLFSVRIFFFLSMKILKGPVLLLSDVPFHPLILSGLYVSKTNSTLLIFILSF